MRILIAEDDFTSRTVLTGLLKKSGHDVIATVNGREAWDTLGKSDAPQLVILDWMMPEMDGVEVIRMLRAEQKDRLVYIILLTSKGEKSDIVTGLEAGADDYLAKPFDPSELRARVEVGRRMIEMQDILSAKMAELSQAFDQIKTLRGIIPICAGCKKIRDDQGYWNQVEVYVRDHTEAKFSHGLCPECLERLYPED